MKGIYYETDVLSNVLCIILFAAALYIAIRVDKKEAAKKGVTVQCQACRNRNGAYKPKHCKNTTCRFN